MTRRTKLVTFIGVAVVVVVALAAMGRARKRNAAVPVRLEKVAHRNLVEAVTASGKIDAKTSVDISADITGRITRIAVKEGDVVKKGQFLLQIDPAQYQAAVARSEAVVATSQAAVVQARANREQAQRSLERARGLAASGQSQLISPEAVEQAQTAAQVADANLRSAQAQADQARASLQQARDDLSKTTLISPINGKVVRLAVETGEVAVPGTFSRETGLLMTVADLSVILAKVKVDETDIVRVHRGDSVQVAIDAFPDTTFTGRVTKISNSAQLAQSAGSNATQDQAVDVDVEVTLDNPPANVRPDLSTTARIVTATRKDALSIPIIALTVRENQKVPNEFGDQGAPARRDTASAFKPQKDQEGVFVVTHD